jgi:hypothetical protein
MQASGLNLVDEVRNLLIAQLSRIGIVQMPYDVSPKDIFAV